MTEAIEGNVLADHQEKKHLVTIEVNGNDQQVPAGKYLVSNFKVVIAVPADHELDSLDDGKLIPLDDGATIHVKKGDAFVSHVRTGSSS